MGNIHNSLNAIVLLADTHVLVHNIRAKPVFLKSKHWLWPNYKEQSIRKF